MKDTINRIIDHIETKLLPVHTKKEDEPLLFHLITVKSLLKQSIQTDEKVNIAKIHEVLHCIETIGIKQKSGFFGQSTPLTMAEILEKHGERILPQEERQQLPLFLAYDTRPKLETKCHELFGPIHHSLYEAAKPWLQYEENANIHKSLNPPKTIWTYTYPTNDNKEILNDPIGVWQASQMNLSSSLTKAYTDFKRDISIRGIKSNTDEDIDALLEYLLESSDYPPGEKPKIKQWLERNGGQDNNRFFDLLLANGEYSGEPGSANLSSKSLEANWTIEDGKVVMNISMVSYAMLIEGRCFVNSRSGDLIAVEPDATSKEGPPLLQLQAKIKLSVNDNNRVKPSVVALEVTSFNKELNIPGTLKLEKGYSNGLPF
ncbi:MULTISPECIES: hypothetical protein [unclassified Legionella]|uniref:hypothetical protein n=1 Tax=unclassified Legionella TaxID=2622702 RepID=UPI0010551A3F|nr:MULTISPECIES: hypothetical protein [unclassified Legionella]MDI9818465.1 hypothetical protein [Legionella sp. PL877]